MENKLYQDEMPEGYEYAGLCYAGAEPDSLREAILEKHPNAKFTNLDYDDIHEYRFEMFLPKEEVKAGGYPKMIH